MIYQVLMENVSGMDSSDIFRLGSMRVHPARYFLESGFRRWFLIFNLQHDIPASLARTRSVTRSQQGSENAKIKIWLVSEIGPFPLSSAWLCLAWLLFCSVSSKGGFACWSLPQSRKCSPIARSSVPAWTALIRNLSRAVEINPKAG